MATVDAQGRTRRALYLPDEVWAWLEATAARDGTSRSDLVEGLVLLAQDREEEDRRTIVAAEARVARAMDHYNKSGSRAAETALGQMEYELRVLRGIL